MNPACIKMTVLVFVAVFAMRARSQTEHSIGSYTTSETERCVCQPHVTINPPVCGRSVPVNSGTGCNCTTVQESVSSELRDMKRQLETLQSAVTSIVRLLTAAHLKDCSEILARGASISGVYTVQPLDSGEAFQVYCDMETDGGGWTVFQRRLDGSVDFYLDFANYRRSFGNLEGEFWLGNDNLHRLTAQGEYEIRVDLSDFENESRYAVYDSFSIADVSDNYTLTVGSYSGTAGDSLGYNNNRQFSTKDRDNDPWDRNCAQFRLGAWWYAVCGYSNLNGAYLSGLTTEYCRGVVWKTWKGDYYSLKTTEMKIRPTPQ